jgi:D-aminoacyl-tRNA deacylase
VGRFHLACIVISEAEVKAVVQRVSEARVRVRGEPVGEVGTGVCVLLGVARGDGPAEAQRLAEKVARLRIFEDEEGRFDRSLLDVGGEALVVSQFTLLTDTTSGKGTRPDFSQAAPRGEAEPLYEAFCLALRELGVSVETGAFGERMAVELVNDGPVTIVLEV